MSCDQFPDGTRRRAICEGSSGLSLTKTNAFRAEFGLEPLIELKEPTPFPVRVYDSAQRPAITKAATSSPCPTCTPRPKPIQQGPGTELKNIFRAADVPSCQLCDAAAQKMNEIGPEECLNRIDELAAEMLPRALAWIKANKPWVHALLPSVVEELGATLRLKQYIRQAVESYQTKQSQLSDGSSI